MTTVKKHLQGGSLRKVMANEILRCLSIYGNESQPIDKAALELGITPKTLRLWLGPVEKGGWQELQVPAGKAMEAFMKAVGVKKGVKKPYKKKTLSKTTKSPTKKPVAATAPLG